MSASRAVKARAKKMPRVAYCSGCGVTFGQHHLLINHRRTDRCGGRFLPERERELLTEVRHHLERGDTTLAEYKIRLQISAMRIRKEHQ